MLHEMPTTGKPLFGVEKIERDQHPGVDRKALVIDRAHLQSGGGAKLDGAGGEFEVGAKIVRQIAKVVPVLVNVHAFGIGARLYHMAKHRNPLRAEDHQHVRPHFARVGPGGPECVAQLGAAGRSAGQHQVRHAGHDVGPYDAPVRHGHALPASR